MTPRKKCKLPEIARYRYRFELYVEGTKLKAESLGYQCRQLEGQPKCKNDFGEPYPLPQYEIIGGQLPPNLKIEIAPKTTQIYLFGEELKPPKIVNVETLEPFIETMATFCSHLEAAEEILNEVAVFLDKKVTFCKESRIYTKTPAMYRLIISSNKIIDQLLAGIEKIFYDEINLAYVEMFQGNLSQAERRIQVALKEVEFFANDIISAAREMKDPRADQWEAEIKKAFNFPTGISERKFFDLI